MGTIGLVLPAQLRRRWRSWLALAALIALAGGFVMAAAAAGRRTSSAFPHFVAAYGFDAGAYSAGPIPKLSELSGVTSVIGTIEPYTGQPTCACTRPINAQDFSVTLVTAGSRRLSRLISGHWPDPGAPDQVLASFTLQGLGVRLGTVVRVPFYARGQASALINATGTGPPPEGPTIAFRVVGFEAAEFEFPAGTTPAYDLYASPALLRTVLSETAFDYAYFVRLRHGAAEMSRFNAEVQALNVPGLEGYNSEDAQIGSVEASIHPQSVGWWALAALAAVVGLAVVGQALSRQSAVESVDYPTMAAVGADRRQLFSVGVARSFLVALAGAAGAVALAVALSPLAPLGEARTAEPATGFSFDVVVLLAGAFATVPVVLVLGAWPAWRAALGARPEDEERAVRPSALVARLAGVGAPASMLVGVSHTLDRRSGDSTVPVASAIIGTVLAVTAISATAVFGASLSHLTATPRLYGDDFQLNFSSAAEGSRGWQPALVRELLGSRDVTGLTEVTLGEFSLDDIPVWGAVGTAVRGPLLFSTAGGHLPHGEGQIGLGATTMRLVGAHVGSTVLATFTRAVPGQSKSEKKVVPFRVVGQVSFPELSAGAVGLGDGALFSLTGFEDVFCPPGRTAPSCLRHVVQRVDNGGGGVLVDLAPGPGERRQLSHYLDAYSSIASPPATPTSLINFGEAVNFPLIFGVIVAVFGAATLAHLLAVSVGRRRREIGLLKALGFVNAQVGSVVAWQATTLGVLGTAVGVPLGVVVGRTVWRAFANNLGVVPVAVVPGWFVAILVPGALAVAGLIALAPALVAARSKPQLLLRGP